MTDSELAATTVRVRKTTRDLINAQARRHRQSVDSYLERLIAEELWRERMQRVKRAMASGDTSYAAETAEWDAVSDADLVDW